MSMESGVREGDGATLTIKKIKHIIINNLFSNTVACKVQNILGPVIIATAYIPLKRPIISRTDFDKIKFTTVQSIFG